MRRLLGQHRRDLDAGRSRADHAATPARDIHAAMRPFAGVVQPPPRSSRPGISGVLVEEIRALFERDEQALIDKDVEVLDATSWNSPLTTRYAIHENGYGCDEIHDHRARRPPGPGIKLERRRLVITTLGRDIATVNLEFDMRGRDMPARQSRTWVRFPDVGWKVVSAHVSVTEDRPAY